MRRAGREKTEAGGPQMAPISGQGQETFAANARQYGIQYPAANDPELKTQKAWAVSYYPTYAVVDRKGIVRVVGLQPNRVEEVVKKLLAEPAS